VKAPELLAELRRRGVNLRLQDGRVHYEATEGVLTRELLENLRLEKEGILEALKTRDHLAPAHRRLEEVTDDIAAIWNTLPPPVDDRPCLDAATEEKIEQAINDRFRAGDAAGALTAIEAWRSAWLAILPPALGPANKSNATEDAARRLSGEKLFDLVHDPATPASDREVYVAEVHHRARELVEEENGLRPHPNQAVYDMFSRGAEGKRAARLASKAPPATTPPARKGVSPRKYALPETRPERRCAICGGPCTEDGPPSLRHLGPRCEVVSAHVACLVRKQNAEDAERWAVKAEQFPPFTPTFPNTLLGRPAQGADTSQPDMNVTPAEGEARHSASAAGNPQSHKEPAPGPAGE